MEKIHQKLREKISLIPHKPGVYLMKSKSGKIIYVGKAGNLKKRLNTYFSGKAVDQKTNILKKSIYDFFYIITNTDQESYLLEDTLIKKHRPKYNVLLKDDKRYPFLKITKEYFPRLIITREFKKDGGDYFGPFSDARAVRKTANLLQTLFPLRLCNHRFTEHRVFPKACLNFQIGKCLAPCTRAIKKPDYDDLVHSAKQFLRGRVNFVVQQLKGRMKKLADELDFEGAKKIKQQLADLHQTLSMQSVFFVDGKSRDVVAGYQEESACAITILRVVEGRLLSKQVYPLKNMQATKYSDILHSFLTQYYLPRLDTLPHQIIVDASPSDFEKINSILKNRLITPQRGKFGKLLLIARKNAFSFVEEQKLMHIRAASRTIFPIQELKEKLCLSKLPRKIICIDISTIQGTDTVASLVFFENGKPKKSNYRHFAIKGEQRQDDYSAIRQTLSRFLTKIDDYAKIDLIIIDGGKGQLSSAKGVLKSFEFKCDLISLAKRLEEVFTTKTQDSIILAKTSSALKLLTKIRDEAHRFAINYHKKRRSSRTLASSLDSIVGKKRKFILLKSFGSVENLKKATFEDLIAVNGIGEALAKRILEKL